MADLPDMSDWSVNQKKDWLRREIPVQAWDSLSSAIIYAGLWAEGFRLRESDFLEVRRERLAEVRPTPDISSLTPDDIIPLDFMEQNEAFQQQRTFHYRMRVMGVDPDTKEPKPSYFSISSDVQLTLGQLEGAVWEMIRNDPNAYHLIADTVTFYKGYIKQI